MSDPPAIITNSTNKQKRKINKWQEEKQLALKSLQLR